MPRHRTSAPATAAIRVRRATPDDLSSILALEAATFTSDRMSRRAVHHWLTAGNGIFLVAVGGGVMLGCSLVVGRADSPAARLYSLATAKAARGRGIGSRLLRRSEQLCRALGCTSMRLEVAVNNHRAISLYRKRGYEVFGHKPGYYEDGRDALRMQKPL